MAQSTNIYVPSGLELPQASDIAGGVDGLYDFMWWISILSFALTLGAVVYFMIRYRRTKKGQVTAYITGNHTLEIIWSAVPSVFLAIIFVWGWVDYKKMRTTEPDAFEVNITGRQWMWESTYQNGKSEMSALHIPKDTPIRLIMTSTDVIHSFYIPAFRVKQDVVPGMFTTLNFKAIQDGDFQVFCAEYCGTNHSGMLAKVTVMEPADFQRWLNGLPLKAASQENPGGREVASTETASGAHSLVKQGEKLFAQKTCVTCHSTGQPEPGKLGPALKGIFGSEVALSNGRKVKADENYLRESMMDSQAKIVAGFPAVMPTFRGQLKDNEIVALIAYIKSLK